MIYVYRRAGSSGAFRLAKELGGTRVRTIPALERGDVLVCWGEAADPITGVKVLNGAPIRNKYDDALTLRAAGVSTIEVSKTRPADNDAQTAPPDDPLDVQWMEAQDEASEFCETTPDRNKVVVDALDNLIKRFTTLRTIAGQPAPRATAPRAQAIWLPRDIYHTGGTDLLNEPKRVGFWVKKEEFTQELRIHSFGGKSLRAGRKTIREDFANPHPWIRSWDGGWKMHYDGVTAQQKHRNIAHEAVKALGLDFGAVDIGERADGTLVVLEVNRAPGIEGRTVPAYAKAIQGVI